MFGGEGRTRSCFGASHRSDSRLTNRRLYQTICSVSLAMNRIILVSVAIVASGFIPSASRFGSTSISALPDAPTSPVITPETRSFIYESARDGVGGETVRRNGDVISGDMVIGARHAHYEGRIAPDGTIPRLEIR